MIFSCVAIVLLSLAIFFAAENKQHINLTPTQLANIEALSQTEGTAVGDCYISSPFNGEAGWYVFCDDKTTNSMIYPRASQKTYGHASVTSKCTK